MDFNNLEKRLERLSNALGKRFDPDIKSHTKVIRKTSGRKHMIGVSFDGGFDESELNNRVFGIISAIGGLKDHLKKQMRKVKKDPQLLEEMINNSLELQLILDLWNQDKHGSPLNKKYRRSNKNPKIVNISSGLSLTGGNKGSVTVSFSGNKATLGSVTENMAIKISGDVVDEEGNLIMKTDEMFKTSLDKIEKFVKIHGLAKEKPKFGK